MKNKFLGGLALGVLGVLQLSAAQSVGYLYRLDTPEVNVVAQTQQGAWVAANKFSDEQKNAVLNGQQGVVVTPLGQSAKAMLGGTFEPSSICDWNIKTDISTVSKAAMPAYAISAPWKPTPRPVSAIATNNKTYLGFIQGILQTKRIKAKAQLVQAFKADLDGDKTDEVVLVATGEAYSMVVVRKVVANKGVKTFVLAEKYPTADMPPINNHHISAIMDTDGNGSMEIIVDDAGHENYGMTVYGWSKPAFKILFEWGCGA